MNLKKLLSEKNFVMHLDAQSKDEVLEEMTAYLTKAGLLHEPEKALQALRARESKMSTGMQHGIAIPHAKTDAVQEMIILIALKKEGLDFQAMDGKPSTIFIMTLSPENRSGPHIQFLAEISKILSRPNLREKLLSASTTDELLILLTI